MFDKEELIFTVIMNYDVSAAYVRVNILLLTAVSVSVVLALYLIMFTTKQTHGKCRRFTLLLQK